MKKDSIIQFVCFETKLNRDEFMPKWERYAKRFMKNSEISLRQSETKSRFMYISQHEQQDQDFRFTFMSGRQSEHFPEHNVKVVQAGGYMPLQVESSYKEDNYDSKLVAFTRQDETDIDFYRRLSFHYPLNIYQGYYENCLFGYMLEFFAPETNLLELAQQLKQHPGVESGIYRDCRVAHQ